MLRVTSFLIFTTLSLLSTTHAAIGPVANLIIANNEIAPDGFSRSCVVYFFCDNMHLFFLVRAVLAGGTFPGPLIKGVKV